MTQAKIGRGDLAEMLAQSLGLEKATELVVTAAVELNLPNGDGDLDPEDAGRVLEKISEEPGLVGLTAMLAKSRLHFTRAASGASNRV